MLTPILVTPPALKALDISEVRMHVRAPESTDDDALLERLIDVAQSKIEGPQGMIDSIYLITQAWRQDYASFACADGSGLRLPFGPVQSIVSVTYYDAANASQTVPGTTYALYTDAKGVSYVQLVSGQTWPASATRQDAVQVSFKAGFGDQSSSVPAAIRQAMLIMIGSWYRDRENEVLGESMVQMPYGATQLLWPYRNLYC